MIKSVTITNYLGEKIRLDLTDPEKSGFVIKEIGGLGPVKADINTTDIATTDGALFNSSRATAREITMKLKFLGGSNYSISGGSGSSSAILDEYVKYDDLVPVSNAQIDQYLAE